MLIAAYNIMFSNYFWDFSTSVSLYFSRLRTWNAALLSNISHQRPSPCRHLSIEEPDVNTTSDTTCSIFLVILLTLMLKKSSQCFFIANQTKYKIIPSLKTLNNNASPIFLTISFTVKLNVSIPWPVSHTSTSMTFLRMFPLPWVPPHQVQLKSLHSPETLFQTYLPYGASSSCYHPSTVQMTPVLVLSLYIL